MMVSLQYCQNGLTTATNKAGGIDCPPAYRPLLTSPLKGEEYNEAKMFFDGL